MIAAIFRSAGVGGFAAAAPAGTRAGAGTAAGLVSRPRS